MKKQVALMAMKEAGKNSHLLEKKSGVTKKHNFAHHIICFPADSAVNVHS